MDSTEIFICYAHEDGLWKNELLDHLRSLQREPIVWSDEQIEGGDDWLKEIEQAMSEAQVAIVLISRDSLGSKFIRSKEVPYLLERRAEEGVKVIPLLVRDCPHKAHEWLKGMQLRPKDGEPLSGRRKHTIEKLLTDLVYEVVNALDESAGEPEQESSAGPGKDRARSLKDDLRRASEAGRGDRLQKLERDMQHDPKLARQVEELIRTHEKKPPARPTDKPLRWTPPSDDNKRRSRQ